MNREKALAILRTYKQEHARDLGIRELGIFGSTARGEAKSHSDVDVVIDMASPDFLTFVRIRTELETLLDAPVDLVRKREGMNALLKQCISEDAVYA